MAVEVLETDQMPEYLLATMPLLSNPRTAAQVPVLAFSLKAVGSGVRLLTVFNQPLPRRQCSSATVHWVVSHPVPGSGVKDEENRVPALEGAILHWAEQTQSDAFSMRSRPSHGGRGREQGMGTLPAQGDLRPLRLRRSSKHGGQRSQCVEVRAE